MRFNFAVYYIVLVFLFVTAFVQAAPVKSTNGTEAYSPEVQVCELRLDGIINWNIQIRFTSLAYAGADIPDSSHLPERFHSVEERILKAIWNYLLLLPTANGIDIKFVNEPTDRSLQDKFVSCFVDLREVEQPHSRMLHLDVDKAGIPRVMQDSGGHFPFASVVVKGKAQMDCEWPSPA
ncbi:hypothetical protein C8J55DRAFT_484925 [Lentinula edodes]|uniref:Uncharacterized protein n=1 Tax=Lentinula lateritia TaxID=40482 RepID=A0A9W9B015_9AGAR|nr:hypothetical protein C8J55DRAFT_484925 [Lentinula edodes]